MLFGYKHGNAVGKGHGSQGVLRNKSKMLQVRVVAPVEQRIENLNKRDSMICEEARRKVKKADVAQTDNISRYFGADIADPSREPELVTRSCAELNTMKGKTS